jgi:glycosyltransferase involved in cell wall biosynthesis
MARRLENHRCIFACLDERGTLADELDRGGFAVHLLGRRAGFDLRCALRLAELLRRENVEVIHAHQYGPFFYSLVARLFCRRPRVLFMEHGRAFPDYPRRKRIVANRLLLERRDRVVAVGNAVRQALVDNEGIARERIGVVYNGIDLAPFATAARCRDQVRRELGVVNDELVIMQVARLDALKDHATAVRTFHRVWQRVPGARLVIVGEGPESSAIERHVRQLGLSAAVQLLGVRSDVPRLLAGADVCLLTSVSEGIPLTLIEAMAAGLPVVATRVGGVDEVVEHEVTGLLAPAGDEAVLAAHITRLAEDATLRTRLGLSGRDRATSRFSEDAMHRGYADLYEEMLAS